MAVAGESSTSSPTVGSSTHPNAYRCWRLRVDGPIAWLLAAEQPDHRYADLELADAVARLRFEHPAVRAVVLAVADYREAHPVLAERTRRAIADASEHSGQTYLAALAGPTSAQGYRLALSCAQLLLVDEDAATITLDATARAEAAQRREAHTDADSSGGADACSLGLVDELVSRADFAQTVEDRALAAATVSPRPPDGIGIRLAPLDPEVADDAIRYRFVRADLDRAKGIATITVSGPTGLAPVDAAELHDQGSANWPLAFARELADLLSRLRTGPEFGTWVLRTEGDPLLVLDHERVVLANAGADWLANEIHHECRRTVADLDGAVAVALIEPGSAFAGILLELALAADRMYTVDSRVFDQEPVPFLVSGANFGPFPRRDGGLRLRARFPGDDGALARLCAYIDQPLTVPAATELGLLDGDGRG